jgi:hypothetical protein
MDNTGVFLNAIDSLRNNPVANKLFRLLRDKEKSGAFFSWFVKEGYSPEEIKEGMKILINAELIEEKDGSSYDPSDVYYKLTDLAYKIRHNYPIGQLI